MHAFLTALVLALVVQSEAADKDKEDAEFAKAQQKKWNELYRVEAASYTLLLDKDPQKVLKMQPDSVLLWSNPVRGGETNGAVFVWTYEGRAEVVGTVFSHLARGEPDKRAIAHSFHSLALEPLAAERGDKQAWTIDVAGIRSEKIAQAPAPANTTPLRLTQMRDLVRDFSAVTTLDGVEQELRLVPQPLYRYESRRPNVIDGALFTFVTGTDPELMLVIEARQTADGLAWHFGAGRFTDLALTLRRKDTVLWKYEPGLPAENGKSPYLSRRTELRSRVLP